MTDKPGLHWEEFAGEFLTTLGQNNAFNRLAARLHYSRRFFRTQKIPYNLAMSVIERHQFLEDNETIKLANLSSLLHDVFYAADKLTLIASPFLWRADLPASGPFDADYQADLLTVFLTSNSRNISLLELKVVFLVLFATNTVEEVVQHCLNLLIDHNRCIHQNRFKLATGALLRLFHRLDSSLACDNDTLNTLVNSSFAKVTGLAGLSDSQFYQFWNAQNRKNTTEISYYYTLVLFSRSLDNDSVHQGIFCNGCNSSSTPSKDIQGIRFKCNRCSSINLCTLCYMTGYQTNRHNPATHKFTLVEESSSADESDSHGKNGNLVNKLLKVFYFTKRNRRATVVKENQEEGKEILREDDGEAVKTIRFLDETLKNVEDLKSGGGGGKDKLKTVIEMLTTENRLFQQNLTQIQTTCNPEGEFYKYLEQHKNILTAQIAHLQEIYKTNEVDVKADSVLPIISTTPATAGKQQKFHSTPFRRDMLRRSINWDLTGLDASTVNENVPGNSVEVSKMIRGEEMDKTYYEANRSNRSLQEISTWLHLRDSFCRELASLPHGGGGGLGDEKSMALNGSGMQSFRELLHKVKDILEDTYSDNVQLSTVTRQLEDALDEIIGKEEQRLLQGTGSLKVKNRDAVKLKN